MRLLEKRIQEEVSQLADQLQIQVACVPIRPELDRSVIPNRIFVAHGLIGLGTFELYLDPHNEKLEMEIFYHSNTARIEGDIMMILDFPLSEELLQELQSAIKK